MIIKKLKKYLGEIFEKNFHRMMLLSLKGACDEQGLTELKGRLEQLVPDITEQYSMFKVDTNYLKIKVRNLHAFQISLFNRIIENFQKVVIVDIGDSAGTHLRYANGLYSKQKEIKCLSVNLDSKAVERIKNKGLEAVNARAEELDKYNVYPNIFLCFELLEHLTDPTRFLYELSSKTNARFLIITVPYLKKSRVGLHHIRGNRQETVCAENTHIFELCPKDWKLLMKQAGWAVVNEEVYLQYPSRSILRLTKPLWKRFDYEGFYGVILKKDHAWPARYSDW